MSMYDGTHVAPNGDTLIIDSICLESYPCVHIP